MKLDELKFTSSWPGSCWAEARVPGFPNLRVHRCIEDGGLVLHPREAVHSCGEYTIATDWINDRSVGHQYLNLDAITAQAILYHLTSGGNDEPR